MPETNPDAIDQRMVRALSHPLRVRILEILSERVASPNDLSAELGVELVDTAQRRGATEHFYRAAARTGLSWIPLDLDERGWDEVASIIDQTQRRVRAAQRRSAGRLAQRPGGARRVAAVVALANFETKGSKGA
jgi:DNA-binding transcriptional ArsR family regulator